MLSAFTARPIVELWQRDRSKIECDRLLVGLNTGSLRIYRVDEQHTGGEQEGQNGSANRHPASPSKAARKGNPVELLREIEKFSTRPVEQLARLKEANVLISLSNYHVSIHDLNTYTLHEQLAKTKNATTFAVTSNIVKDSATGVPEIISRLAVAVKRRLLLWTWQESEMSSVHTEIVLAEPIRTLTWASATQVMCGMNSGYVIADVITKKTEDIVGPGAIGGAMGNQGGRFGGVGSASMGYIGLGSFIPKPLATKLAEGEMLLAKDINTLFVSSNGQTIEKRQIPWQTAPDTIGYSYPYITALLAPSKGALEIRNPDTLSLLQTIFLLNANQMHFPPPTASLAHAGKGFHVASDVCIWRMDATDYDAQIDELVASQRYDEAISILNMLENALLHNKTQRLKEVEGLKRQLHFDREMEKAQILFDNGKYREAVDIFIAVEAPPERVIKLYPKIIAGNLSTVEEHLEESGAETENHRNGTNGSIDTKGDVDSPKSTAVSKLIKSDTKSSSDTSSIRSFTRLDETDDSKKPAKDKPLEGKDLNIAALELNAFLVGTRNRMKKVFDIETGKLRRKDSGQNSATEATFESLLRGPQSDSEKERENRLIEMAKLVDTTLFRSYMLSNPQLAGSLFRIPNLCDPAVVNQKLMENGRYNDLVDFFHGKKLHRPALELLKKFGTAEGSEATAPALRGPRRTVGYLQNLPPELIDLILEFADWPLRADPELGMEIFLADSENAETLPRERVIEFLRNISVDLEVRYLEHVIRDLNDTTPDFHNRLVTAYLEGLRSRIDRQLEDWKVTMKNLLLFLRSSNQYSQMKAFNLIVKDDPDFYEAQAVVLSNMGQHKQALEIYVFKLQDYEKAEEYCNLTHLHAETSNTVSPRPSTSEPDDPLPSIYHTLLSLYLTPPPSYSQNWPPALSLLSKHGSRLPASSTLSLIPDSLPIAELESYFRGRIRSANSIINETRVVTGLRKTEMVSAQATLLLGDEEIRRPGCAGRSRRVLVSEERVCGVCHKRLGQSVIAVLKDNTVVHYGCLGRARQSPSQQPRTLTSAVESVRGKSWGQSS